MSVLETLLDLGATAIALLYVTAFWKGGLASDLLNEGRRQWEGLSAPLRDEHSLLPAFVLVGGLLLVLTLSHAVEAGMAAIVSIVSIVYLSGRLLLRAAGVPVLRILSRVLSRAEMEADGFKIPLTIFNTSGAVSKFSRVVSLPEYQSIGFFGATRSGKTTTIRHVLDQIDPAADEPVVVYDHKDDYRRHFEERGYEIDRLSTSGGTVRWNLFREIETEADADEIARAIFPTESGDATADHFNTRARQAFAAVLKFLNRELDHPNNEDLVRFFRNNDGADIYEQISESRYNDLDRAVDPFDPDNRSNEGSGIESTLTREVLDTFVGEFGEDAPGDLPEWSVREYMAKPRGRVMVLDYPRDEGEQVKPILRFMLDRAAATALAPENDGRGAYFVLDEFARIPGLRQIEELCNVGAGKNVQVFAAMQSVAQLYDNYGERAGESILAGLVSSVILRLNDEATVEFARGSIGTSFETYTKHVDRQKGLDGGMVEKRRETKREEEHAFAEGDLRRFDTGEAVIVRPDGWVHGQIDPPQ